MIVHLGSDISIRAKDVIMILDIRTVTEEQTACFLDIPKNKTIDIGGECKSLILAGDSSGYYLYRSPISAATLKKRVESGKLKVES